jgi:thiamine pyrophosphate-dependent acetolactate synthase large subunit-like protein
VSGTVADQIVGRLASAGVREVFGVAGGALTPLLLAISRCDSITYTGVRHEAAGAQMAAAVNQSTGRLAVCLGEQGPGTLNVVSGLGGARNNSLAVLVLTVSGHSRTSRPGSGALMELDATLASAAVTKWRRAVRAPEDVTMALARAMHVATEARPGPVHVDIPRDLLAVPSIELTADLPAEQQKPVPAARLAEILRVLSAAERPLVIAGGGAARSHAEDILREIVRHLGAAAACTQMGIGVLPSDGPTFVGHGGVIAGPALIRAAEEADVILAVGCRFSSWWWRHGQRLGSAATLVQIDTDPEACARSGAGDHGLVGDAGVVLAQLWDGLRDTPARHPGGWVAGVHADLLAHRRRLDALAEERAAPAHPAALARELADLIDADSLVVLDGGHTTFWSNDFAPALRPRTVLHEPGMAQLGFGVPYANALALAHPDRQVVTITGDGSFGFCVAELDTARRLGLRTITVIHDNSAWGVISLAQRSAGFSLGTDLSGTDYAAIATGFGCLGLRVADLADLPKAFAQARASDLPVVIDVVVRFEPHPMMPDFGRAIA